MDDKNTMLIDAAHPEETRVVVLKENRVEEFDHESAAKRPLRGNIYLAKVTRVEPSLQAAFVEYGGNRHGFLAFNEIHPDYYQIPVADRERLLEAEAEDERAASAAEECDSGDEINAVAGDAGDDADGEGAAQGAAAATLEVSGCDATLTGAPEDDDSADASADTQADDEEGRSGTDADEADETVARDRETSDDDDADDAGEARRPRGRRRDRRGSSRRRDNGDNDDVDDDVELVGSEDALEEVPERTRRPRRQYKIQEVIKRRQIILVQVVKEERGNKGAALTTYLSLAGRYTVLMPNTARGGGISRKITTPADRKRLRKIATELEVPLGMGLIIRTAGATRTKSDIKRDFEYLLRLWETVRELTLQSTAPALVYEEGNLIKRSIRDLYSKEIDEVLVAGDDAYREAKDFMRMLMPSHAKNVRAYKEPEPLFARYQIERQLNAMFSPIVTLPSGGYVVVNQTEALVAIDVNSGKATRERSIEETALNTNMEAAAEIARQLKLRDLAGLIVIDFIDMEERRNNRSVERKFKDCLKTDRARIQMGRISHFGLMEMSRQRLRTGVLEGSTTQCPHCQGTGVIRSVESVALAVLRALEDAFMAGHRGDLVANTSNEIALYILNQKRMYVNDLEARYGCNVVVSGSERHQGANFTIERAAATGNSDKDDGTVIQMDWAYHESETGASQENGGRKKSRQRKRKRKRRDEDGRVVADAETEAAEAEGADASGAGSEDAADAGEQDEGGDKPKRSRRRGKRGGRRNRQARSDDGQSENGDDGQHVSEAEEGAQAPQSEARDADSDASDAGDFGQAADVVDETVATGYDSPTAEADDGADEAAETQTSRPRTPRSRRRPRRAGNGSAQTDTDAEAPAEEAAADSAAAADSITPEESVAAAPEPAEKAVAPAAGEPAQATAEVEVSGAADTGAPQAASAYEAAAQTDQSQAESADDKSDEQAQAVTASATVEEEPDSGETRRGWWQRRLRGA